MKQNYKIAALSESVETVPWVKNPALVPRKASSPLHQKKVNNDYLERFGISFELRKDSLLFSDGKSFEMHLALERATHEFVMVKKICKEFISMHDIKANVQREIQIHRQMDRFCSYLFSVLETTSELFLVMEYCALGNLESLVLRKKIKSWNAIGFYLKEIAQALNYLHNQKDTIYLSMHPRNVGISATGHIKLTNFCQSTPIRKICNLKKKMRFCLDCLPPECLKLSELNEISTKSDFWSLGVMFYYMLSHKLPFGKAENTSLEIIYSRMTSPYRKPRLSRLSSFNKPKSLMKSFRILLHGLLNCVIKDRFGFEDVKSALCFKASTKNPDVNLFSVDHLLVKPPFIPRRRIREGFREVYVKCKPSQRVIYTNLENKDDVQATLFMEHTDD